LDISKSFSKFVCQGLLRFKKHVKINENKGEIMCSIDYWFNNFAMIRTCTYLYSSNQSPQR